MSITFNSVAMFILLVLTFTAINLVFEFRGQIWRALKRKMKHKRDTTEQM